MAENFCDVLNKSFYGTSADVEDFRPAQQGIQNDDLSNFLKLRKSALGTFFCMHCVLNLLFALLYSFFFIPGSP